ncbi:MAG: riboflavin synthase [bacterium]
MFRAIQDGDKMFTGLIEHTGIVKHIEKKDSGALLAVSIKTLTSANAGDSIAVNGACLTLLSLTGDIFSFDISTETMQRSNFSRSRTGDVVNIEMPLKVTDRLHGHIVNGHVDCTARIAGIKSLGKHHIFTFELSEKTPYLVEKGFIAVDGISVTPYGIKERAFNIAVIPYTYEHTNLNTKQVGDIVNIEFDIIAKYVESMLNKHNNVKLTEAFLKEKGFA